MLRASLADIAEQLRQPEVGEFERSVLVQQDVGRLEVAMDDAVAVKPRGAQ